jgi:putative ABC transport system permease protein
MFRNYLVTALRNAGRHKLYSFINVAGLAVALTCAIFIALFIRDELSYDSWIPGTENVYRAEISLSFPGEPPLVSTATPFVLGPTLKSDLPDVQAETHFTPQLSTVKVGDREFSEHIVAVDPNFFMVIPLPLVQGNPASVLGAPASVVLSQAAARKYFGEGTALGKTILVDAKYPLTVTGIMRDLPHNTQLSGDVFISNLSKAAQISQDARANWFQFNSATYVRLVPGADPGRVEEKERQLFARQIDMDRIVSAHISTDKMVRAHLEPFRDVHMVSDAQGGAAAGGRWTEVYGFGAIAALILLIACFNFTNLATARAMMRAREVSLRKVMGARRRQLIAQFLGESVLTALIALILALSAAEVLRPAYDNFIGRAIALDYISDWPLVLGAVTVAIAAGLLGGLYPAFVLSGFRPAVTLKTNASGQGGSGKLRAGLVVLQFAISIGLGIAALVVFAQITYARNVDLGFDRDNIVVIDLGGGTVMSPSAADSFLHALDADPSIVAAAQSNTIPFTSSENRSSAIVPGNPTQFTVSTINISPEFPDAYGMKLAAGRMLSRDRSTDMSNLSKPGNDVADGTNVLIDEVAARMFGFTPADAVGRTIEVEGHRVTIVGVLHNALFQAARGEPVSTLYYFNPLRFKEFSIRVKGGRIPEGIAAIDRTWQKFVPTVAIRRHFLDDLFDEMFAADEQEGTMFAVFVGIAIFIACLGLFGLAAFTAERRTREIGIRKVFGARTRDVIRLLLWQFSIPVLIANIFAWPVAYYYLHGWLETYAYRISLNPLYFIAAGAVALVIAWVTVFAHALRVARANPIRALRYE